MAATIDTLRKRGYQVGFAHGSVAAEEEALAAAHKAADPANVERLAAQTTAHTISALDAVGAMPRTPDARRTRAAEIADRALQLLTERADERVAFHQAALEIAQEMPDVYRVEQLAEDGSPLVSVLVACQPDGTGWDDAAQELLDSLADAKAFKARAKRSG